MERDAAKIATLLVFGAILVDIGTHGSAFSGILNILGTIWTKSLSTVAGH